MMREHGARLAALLLGVLLLVAGLGGLLDGLRGRERFGVLDERALLRIPVGELEDGALYITEGRRLYQRGKMTLIVPAIDLYSPVGESTDEEGLQAMPGLYEFSQLPAEGDVNVSIAGHRDIYDMIFLHLDRLGAGDYLYLLYDGMVFRYIYKQTRIVRPDNWDSIRPQGYSCLTLTTCDPIGTTRNRLIVQAELVDWQAFDQDYRFVADSGPQI